MRLALMSDFHLGYNDDALMQAREALNRGLREADLVVLTGDLFDHRVPKQEVLHDAIALFGDLKASAIKTGKLDGVKVFTLNEQDEPTEVPANTPFIAIYGTHERRSKGLINAVQMLTAAGLVFNCHARKVMVQKGGESIVFQGMGGLPEQFARQAFKLLDPKPVKKAFNVFLLHQTLKELIPFDEEFLAIPDLPEGFDLYVDGHIHWNRELKANGRHVLLPGSTVITQMKPNEQHGKGYYLYDTKTKEAEFKYINARPFHYVELKFEGATFPQVESQVRERVSGVLAGETRGKPLLKFKLLGSLAKGLTPSGIDAVALEREFSQKAFLSIDKEFDTEELKQKVDILRRMRAEWKGSRELGLRLLRERLEALESPLAAKTEELFDSLSTGEVDDALSRLD